MHCLVLGIGNRDNWGRRLGGSARKLSVFSGIGTAILGYKGGDAIDWRIQDRTRCIRIEKVLYQPEAAGDFHL